ncbi:DUF2267 domain-containing protein [Nocardia sp. NPDC049190]|uniref:DUF2267 domain-containing protein n=1 Tax=Nocardia sp. NPDC049190 TaxID=3155650 RepID=UPI0033D3D585
MEAEEIFRTVADRASLSREEAADLTRAVLLTVADRLSRGEIRELRLRLPAPLDESLSRSRRTLDKFGLDEFLRRISGRTGLNADETSRGVSAVLTVLRDANIGNTFDHAMSQLPSEFRQLVWQE